MSSSSPLLNDLLSLGSNVFGQMLEARHDMKSKAKSQMDSMAKKLDLVSRDEFDAAFAMLSKARLTQDELAERLDRIEAHLGMAKTSKKKTAARKNPSRKS